MCHTHHEVKDVKRLIGITGAFLLIYVIMTAAMTPAGEATLPADREVSADENTAMYTAREDNGRIVIESGGGVTLRTDTDVRGLPKIDRLRLEEGIELYSEKELKSFLEDYCS